MGQLLDTLPETPQNLAERAAVRAQLMIYLARIGDSQDQAPALFREGRELATRSGDPHVLSQVLNGFGFLRLLAGAVAKALDPLIESVRRADETEDIGLRAAVRYGLSNAYFYAGGSASALPLRSRVFSSLGEISASAPIESGLARASASRPGTALP